MIFHQRCSYLAYLWVGPQGKLTQARYMATNRQKTAVDIAAKYKGGSGLGHGKLGLKVARERAQLEKEKNPPIPEETISWGERYAACVLLFFGVCHTEFAHLECIIYTTNILMDTHQDGS